MKKPGTDILFVTYMQVPGDTGDPAVYQPLRYHVGPYPATIPLLRMLARGSDADAAVREMTVKRAAMGLPPVLTPMYLEDYMDRRGLSFAEVPCLETGMQQVEALLAGGVGVIAICTTWAPASGGAEPVRAAAARLKAMAPHVPVVAGGVGVRKGLRVRSLMCDGWFAGTSAEELARHYLLIDPLQDGAFDAIIYSEGGEATLAALARRVREGKDYHDLPNLAYVRDGGYVFSPADNESSDVDGEIVDWSHYRNRLSFFEAPVRTALGCPFRCEFCDFAELYKPRLRSLDSLLAELRTLAGASPAPRRVFFTDDNVAINRQRLTDLCRALIRERMGLAWRAFVRADAIDAEGADLMKDSGCQECLLGLESGDPTILANMRKHLDPDRALRAIELLDARGIGTQCTFVVGFPGECRATLDRTTAFISAFPSGPRAGAVHRYYLFPFYVAPLCPVASPASRSQFGLTGTGERWRHSTMDSEEARQAVREVFHNVNGPSHMYLEQRPPDWPAAASREVMELRDRLQKDRLNGRPADHASLLEAVRCAEKASSSYLQA